jgi:Mg2+ and Co2+ transporter CorA
MGKNQKTSNNRAYTTVSVATIILGFFGFRFVTQAGQSFPIQNDGYAMVGGIVILISGLILGYIYGKRGKW